MVPLKQCNRQVELPFFGGSKCIGEPLRNQNVSREKGSVSMTNIQPCLVPCKGTLADLHVVDDPNNSNTIQVFWGTSVLQVIPRNRGTDIPPFSEQSRGYFHLYKFVKKNCR